MITFLSNSIDCRKEIGYTEPEELILNTKSNTVTVPELTPTNTANSAEEANLPPTYAKLPATKLEEEPNLFEQSFEGATKIVPLPPETAQPIMFSTIVPHQSMLSKKNNLSSVINTVHIDTKDEISEQSKMDSHRLLSNLSKSGKKKTVKKTLKINKPVTEEDEMKRKNFLERNRIAALKCRQRKKQWLQDLQAKVEFLTTDNEEYNMQMTALREELIHLKTILTRHKDCPINQQATAEVLSRPIPGLPSLAQPCEYVNNIPVIQQPLPNDKRMN
ncbi:unnamed protein product [Rhizopus stolonifer]